MAEINLSCLTQPEHLNRKIFRWCNCRIFFYFPKVSPEKSNSLHRLEGILASQQLLSLEDGLKGTVKAAFQHTNSDFKELQTSARRLGRVTALLLSPEQATGKLQADLENLATLRVKLKLPEDAWKVNVEDKKEETKGKGKKRVRRSCAAQCSYFEGVVSAVTRPAQRGRKEEGGSRQRCISSESLTGRCCFSSSRSNRRGCRSDPAGKFVTDRK